MKIKSFNLENYGPIKKFSLSCEKFELIFGLNERGKTALVEALGYYLFRMSSPRYGKPEGLVIELEKDGKVHTIFAKKPCNIFTSPEVSRLMYVVASDSAIYDKNKQVQFWDAIKLLLSQTEGKFSFAELAQKIREKIGYFPKRDDWKPEKRQIIEKDIQNREELQRYIKEQNEIERKYQNLVRLNEEYKNLKEELNNMQIAKKYSVYQELKALHGEYLDCKSRLSLYDRYEDEFYKRWQHLEAEKKGLIFITQNQKELQAEISELENQMKEIETKQRFIQNQGFYEYLTNLKEPQAEPTLFYPFLFFLLGFIVLILSFKIGFTLSAPFALFLASVVALFIVYYRKMSIRKIELKKQEWIAKAQIQFPEVETIDQLRKAVDDLSDNKIKLQTLIDAKKEQLEKSQKMKNIEEIDAEIESLRQKTGCATIEQLKQKLIEKEEVKKRIEGIYARIFNILAEKDVTKWAGL
ncbi:MAG: AAA family ATPase, partial [candidate division WOR-3 bacterium]